MADTRASQRTEQRKPLPELRDYDEDDKYFIPEHEKPEGMSYDWKRFSVYGQEDKGHMTKLQRMGYWASVPGSRHPQFGFEGEQPIIVDGLMLMERAKEYTDERHRREEVKAKKQVSDKLAEMEMGEHTPLKPQRGQNKIKRTMEIPD